LCHLQGWLDNPIIPSFGVYEKAQVNVVADLAAWAVINSKETFEALLSV